MLSRECRRGRRRSQLSVKSSLLFLLPSLLCLLFFPACSKRADSSTRAETKSAAAEKRFPLTGEILRVDAARQELRVKHAEIPGYMPAMTMDFTVSLGDATVAKVGQKIRAELVELPDGEFRLEKIWPADPAANGAVEAAAKTLTQETVTLGRKAYREVGERAPDFTLYDQDARVVESRRFRGKQVMLNFIFTRCPVAKMCPAAVARFQQTQRLAREKGIGDLELISFTLDPEYDTPGVLKEYAIQRVIDTSNYSLLTGPQMAIKSLLEQFGILTELKGDLLNHTAATLLLDETGRIIHRADGSEWDVNEFVGKMRK
jgi:protein SCO1/2